MAIPTDVKVSTSELREIFNVTGNIVNNWRSQGYITPTHQAKVPGVPGRPQNFYAWSEVVEAIETVPALHQYETLLYTEEEQPTNGRPVAAELAERAQQLEDDLDAIASEWADWARGFIGAGVVTVHTDTYAATVSIEPDGTSEVRITPLDES